MHLISGTLFCLLSLGLVGPCLLSDTYSRPISILITHHEPSFNVHNWFLVYGHGLIWTFPWHPSLLYGGISCLGRRCLWNCPARLDVKRIVLYCIAFDLGNGGCSRNSGVNLY